MVYIWHKFFELLNKWKFLSLMDEDSVVKRNEKTSPDYLYKCDQGSVFANIWNCFLNFFPVE